MAKTLVVEDDRNLLDTLRYNLRKEGHDVVTAVDGAEALAVARREKPDLIILDIMLPKLSGFEDCRILKKEMTTPILMLTAKDEEIDKVVGLEIGADDYMTKPFSMRELLARLGAMLRRAEIFIRQGLSRRDRNRVTCVNTHWIKVFDRTDNNAVIVLIPHHFHFIFFPAQDRFFDQ